METNLNDLHLLQLQNIRALYMQVERWNNCSLIFTRRQGSVFVYHFYLAELVEIQLAEICTCI